MRDWIPARRHGLVTIEVDEMKEARDNGIALAQATSHNQKGRPSLTPTEYTAIAAVTEACGDRPRVPVPCPGCEALRLCHPDARETHTRLLRYGWERLARDHMYECHPDEYHSHLTRLHAEAGGRR